MKRRHRFDGDFDRVQELIREAIRRHEATMHRHEHAIDMVRQAADELGGDDDRRRTD